MTDDEEQEAKECLKERNRRGEAVFDLGKSGHYAVVGCICPYKPYCAGYAEGYISRIKLELSKS